MKYHYLSLSGQRFSWDYRGWCEEIWRIRAIYDTGVIIYKDGPGTSSQTLGKFDQQPFRKSLIKNASQKESAVTFVFGVFFGILLLRVYNQNGYFSLAYAMLVAIFMILGALGLLILLV